MKKLLVLAVSAILVANISAQEQKKEGCKDKQLTKEERVEFEIRRFKHELMLSDQQAEKFAVTYREYAGKLDEVFGTGTAAVISPVGHLKWNDKVMEINGNKIGKISQMLYDTMTGIQWGKIEDTFNWIVPVE